MFTLGVLNIDLSNNNINMLSVDSYVVDAV